MLPQSVTPPGPDGFDSGDGGHVFSETYEQHQANVAKWRKVEREKRKREQEAAEQPAAEQPAQSN